MFQTLERYNPDGELLPSAPTDKTGPTDHELCRQPGRRSRPLTFIQEALFLAALFVIGVALQAFVLLNIAGVIE